MHFKEILANLTGVSIPIFGIQWKPVTLDVTIARNLLRVLEDKRVLYRPHEMEGVLHCFNSVTVIRQELTDTLQQVDAHSPLNKPLQKARRSCREFCDIIGSPKFNSAAGPVQKSLLARELTKLRHIVGNAVGEIAIGYGLDVEDELASIIPFNNVR